MNNFFSGSYFRFMLGFLGIISLALIVFVLAGYVKYEAEVQVDTAVVESGK